MADDKWVGVGVWKLVGEGMSTSDTIGALATALVAAQADMANATVNRENSHFKNRYADLAAIRDATLPALNKNGLAIIQTTQIIDAGAVLVTRLAHKSGEWIEGTYPLPTGVAPQVLGSALTYARRYSWAAVCGVASEEDDDGEATRIAPAQANGKHANGNGITAEQLTTLRGAIKEVDADEASFCKYLKIDALAKLPASQYQLAMAALDAKRARQ